MLARAVAIVIAAPPAAQRCAQAHTEGPAGKVPPFADLATALPTNQITAPRGRRRTGSEVTPGASGLLIGVLEAGLATQRVWQRACTSHWGHRVSPPPTYVLPIASHSLRGQGQIREVRRSRLD